MVLWMLVLKSGVHATVAGVALAMTIPLVKNHGTRDGETYSPLHALEHALHRFVAFVVVPVFGFANAGVALGGTTLSSLAQPLTLGIAGGLVAGKVIGVFATAWLAIKAGFADAPVNAAPMHVLGVALLCGIGFTMSLFVSLLAFPDLPALQDAAKIGILAGSVVAAILGAIVFVLSPRPGGHEAREF
jgi:NhaA family Na+:H+ antiporter